MNRRSLLALAFTLICTGSFLAFDFAAAQTTSGYSGGVATSTASSTNPSGDQGQSYQHLKPPPSPPKNSGGGGGDQKCPSPYGGSKASNTADENIARDSNALCHTSGSANYFKGIPPGGSCKMGPKTMKNLDNLNCDAPGGIKGKCSAQTHTCKATNPSGKPNPSGIKGRSDQPQATSTASTTTDTFGSFGSFGSFGTSGPLDDGLSTTAPDFLQADSNTNSSASGNTDATDSGSQTGTTQGNINSNANSNSSANANAPINWTGLSTWNGWNGASASTPGKANQGNAANNGNKASGPANTGEPQTNNIKSNSQFQESVGFDQWSSIFSVPSSDTQDTGQTAPSGGLVSNPGQYTASASFTDDSYLARHPIQPSALQRIYDSIMSVISNTLHSL